LLQVFYSVRSERLLVEQIDYNLLFRWYVGLGMDDAVRNHAVFSKNRLRLLTSDVAQRFFAEVNQQAKKFMSNEHFTGDGTLIQAWASQKSFRPKDTERLSVSRPYACKSTRNVDLRICVPAPLVALLVALCIGIQCNNMQAYAHSM
jgi:hypothetical protein